MAAATVVALWLAFLAYLAAARPRGMALRDATRLVPDTLRLLRHLATDSTVPRRQRVPLWLLAGYLALPVDLVPDFIPGIGYADDVILVAVVLRRFLAKAGADKLTEHWPGSAEGLELLRRLLRLAV